MNERLEANATLDQHRCACTRHIQDVTVDTTVHTRHTVSTIVDFTDVCTTSRSYRGYLKCLPLPLDSSRLRCRPRLALPARSSTSVSQACLPPLTKPVVEGRLGKEVRFVAVKKELTPDRSPSWRPRGGLEKEVEDVGGRLLPLLLRPVVFLSVCPFLALVEKSRARKKKGELDPGALPRVAVRIWTFRTGVSDVLVLEKVAAKPCNFCVGRHFSQNVAGCLLESVGSQVDSEPPNAEACSHGECLKSSHFR